MITCIHEGVPKDWLIGHGDEFSPLQVLGLTKIFSRFRTPSLSPARRLNYTCINYKSNTES